MFAQSGFRATHCLAMFLMICALCSPVAWSQTVPANPLGAGATAIDLDSSFQADAWLVYTYDIDANGRVVDAAIRQSNGVPDLEAEVLRQLNSWRFTPAQRGGKPVRSSAYPVVYTWILDKQREMSPEFARLYQQAWDHYAAGDFAAAGAIAAQLQDYSGRNALEEVKSRLLAASLANRSGEEMAELRHLSRIVDFQSLALENQFRHVYVAHEQYLKVLDRLLSLQLQSNMLADAGATLDQMQSLARGETIVESAAERYLAAEKTLQAAAEFTVEGELLALYPKGPAAWRTGLTHRTFHLGDVHGRVAAVYLVCAQAERSLAWPAIEHWVVPVGWSDCQIDISGTGGTRVVLHQLRSR